MCRVTSIVIKLILQLNSQHVRTHLLLIRGRILEQARGTVPLRHRILLRINIKQKQSYGENWVLRYRKCFENPASGIENDRA